MDTYKILNWIINRYYPYSSLEREELFQIAYMAYLLCLKNYKEEYGPISVTYIACYVRREINKELRKDITGRQYEYLDNINGIIHVEEDASNKEISDIIYENKPKLTEREMSIITRLYYNDETQIEIARDLNVSKQAINKTKDKALNKIRGYINV